MTKVTKDLMKRCNELGLDGNEVFQKSKLLLESYRGICFSARCRALDLRAEAEYAHNDLSSALVYLHEFAPDSEKDRFESRVSSLFETERLVSLVDFAMDSMYEYFTRCKLYHELLSKAYLTKWEYRSDEIADILGVDLKVYYLRRQEAILLFGNMMWGHVIPYIQTFGWPTPQMHSQMVQQNVGAAS